MAVDATVTLTIVELALRRVADRMQPPFNVDVQNALKSVADEIGKIAAEAPQLTKNRV